MGGLNEKQLTIISIVGGVVITAVIGVMCYLEWDKIQVKKEQTAQLSKQLEGYQRKIGKIDGLKGEIKILQKTFAVYRKTLPANVDDIDRFYRQLYDWRLKLNIDAFAFVKSKTDEPLIWPNAKKKTAKKGLVKPRPAQPVRGGVKDYVINSRNPTMTVNFWQLGQLLSLIENWGRLAIITDLSINTGGKYQYGDIKLKVGFTIKTFFYTGSELPEVIRDDPEFQKLSQQEITAATKELVFGKPFFWTLKGTDAWDDGSGPRPGGTGPDAMPRNPFDPFPALSEKVDEDVAYVAGLKRSLAKIEKLIAANRGVVSARVKVMLNRLLKSTVRKPSGPAVLTEWTAHRAQIDHLLTPGNTEMRDKARMTRLEKMLIDIRRNIQADNTAQAQRLFKQLESKMVLPPKSPAALARWNKLKASIATIRKLLEKLDVVAALVSAKALLEQIKKQFAEGKYDGIEPLSKKIADLSFPWPRSAELKQVHEQSIALNRRAKLRKKFAELRVKLTGVIDVTGGAKFAFINNARYTVGDVLKIGETQIRITAIQAARDDKIREMSVTFDFEGEEVTSTRSVGK